MEDNRSSNNTAYVDSNGHLRRSGQGTKRFSYNRLLSVLVPAFKSQLSSTRCKCVVSKRMILSLAAVVAESITVNHADGWVSLKTIGSWMLWSLQTYEGQVAKLVRVNQSRCVLIQRGACVTVKRLWIGLICHTWLHEC